MTRILADDSDEEFIDSFFTIKPNVNTSAKIKPRPTVNHTPTALSSTSAHRPNSCSTHSLSDQHPSPSLTPSRLPSIPRRPNEKQPSAHHPPPLNTPSNSSRHHRTTTNRSSTHLLTPSRTRNQCLSTTRVQSNLTCPPSQPINSHPFGTSAGQSTPPPLPPPLELPQIQSKCSEDLASSTVPSNRSTQSASRSSSSFGNKKEPANRPSTCIHPAEPEFDQILVPDSTDSPQNSPKHPAYLRSHRDQCPFVSDQELEGHCDPVPKLLFNPPLSSPISNHSPPRFSDSRPNRLIKNQSSIKSTSLRDASEKEDEEIEEEKRQRLLLELGFDEQLTADLNDCVAPLSSSPIEIVQTTRSNEPEVRNNEKKKQRVTRSRVTSNSTNETGMACEWDDQSKFQPIQSNSSSNSTTLTSKRAGTHPSLFATPQDQIRHVGVIVDDSDGEEGDGNTGIAPLMNSWPASKRTTFMKMAGLKAKEIGDGIESAEDQAKEVAEWDQLLKRHKSNGTHNRSNTDTFSSGAKKHKLKKTWNNRSLFKFRKKKSSSSAPKPFKSFPKSSCFKKSKS